MGGLTFGVIVAGDRGFGAPEVLAALAVAVVALALFMAVAVFGALLADRAHVLGGLRESLLIAAAVTASLRGTPSSASTRG